MKERLLSIKKKKIICNFCLLLVVISLASWFRFHKYIVQNSNFVDSTISIFSLLITIISVWLISYQLRETKKIQEAEFIIHLNQSFVDNMDYARMYSKLEKSYKKHKKPDLSRVEISNYLTFFETVYLLLNSGVINIQTLDDLFEYRFFLAVHNETVQKLKLIDTPYNFRNIYYLEDIWMKYRKSKGLLIYEERNTLFEACKRAGKEQLYISIMNDRERKK